MDAPSLVGAALISGLLALERKAILQAALSRPLVASALVGLALGRPAEGLGVGAALELFHLGAVSLGAAMPDNELFTAVAGAGCASALASTSSLPLPAVLACAVLATLPAAKLGVLADRLSLQLNSRVVRLLEGVPATERIRHGLWHNLYGLWVPFLTTAAACLLGVLLGLFVLPALLGLLPGTGPARGLAMAWGAFLVVSAAAAARAVQTPHGLGWALAAAAVSAGTQAAGLWEGR